MTTQIPRHTVFISFKHEDTQQVNGFIGMTNFDNDFDFINRKLDYMIQGTTETIANTIRENYIKKSVVTVVLLGERTHITDPGDWINREIKMTLRQKHGLLGIFLKDVTTNKVPVTLYESYQNKYAEILWWKEYKGFRQAIHDAFTRSQRFNDYDFSKTENL